MDVLPVVLVASIDQDNMSTVEAYTRIAFVAMKVRGLVRAIKQVVVEIAVVVSRSGYDS